jgi:sialidase-1
MSPQRRPSPLQFTLLFACSISLSAFAAADLHRQDLFEAGAGGYEHYRIPGIIITSRSVALAYCEARQGGGDWGRIDLFLRRSTDGGKTWEQPRKIAEPPPGAQKNQVALAQQLGRPDQITLNNPVAIADRNTPGLVHFLYCVEYARCFYIRSADDGATWSRPIEITAAFDQFRPRYPWKVIATGPGHGIQLRNGRLLVPVWLSTGTGGHAHRPSCVSTLYSDDAGKTWRPGDIVATDPAPLKNPSETAAVQLAQDAGGAVMLNLRHEGPHPFRAIATSKDGATAWTEPRIDPQLPEPVCMGTLLRLTERPAFATNRLLFANPHNDANRQRRNLTVKLSYDEGQTWPIRRTIEEGVSGYSDLAVSPDGTIFCLYERGAVQAARGRIKALTLARFDLEWLTQGKDRLDPARSP